MEATLQLGSLFPGDCYVSRSYKLKPASSFWKIIPFCFLKTGINKFPFTLGMLLSG